MNFEMLFTDLILQHREPKYESLIAKALNYVVSNVDEIDDLYALSVAAYALQLAEHPSRTKVLDLLVSKSITKGELKGRI